MGVLSLLLFTAAVDMSKVRAQTAPRSDTRIRFVDDRKQPSQSVRRRAGGWEARGPHIVVFSPNGAAEAQRIVQQMEATWSEAASLADAWTNTHRQPNFGIGSVNVRVIKRGRILPRSKDPREVFLASTDDLNRNGSNARRAAVRAFFDVTEMNRAMPEWLENGLTSYLVGQRASALVQATTGTRQPSAAWARALLEAEDGQHAWKLFDALAAATRDGASQTSPSRVAAALTSQVDARKVAQTWMGDPLSGQPLLKAPPKLDDEVRPIVADMLEVLKLDRRFAPHATGPVRPKIVGSGLLPADPWAAEKPPSHWSMRATRDRMLSPNASRWATIDARGRLLTSRNRAEIEELFDRAERRLVPVVEGEKRMLRATLHDGRVVEGWLEENREDPSRPILNIRVVRPGSLAKSNKEKTPAKEPVRHKP